MAVYSYWRNVWFFSKLAISTCLHCLIFENGYFVWRTSWQQCSIHHVRAMTPLWYVIMSHSWHGCYTLWCLAGPCCRLGRVVFRLAQLTKNKSPKVIWEEHVALAQPHNKSPLVSVGCPTFAPRLPLPLRQLSPLSNNTHPSTDPTHHPKQHLDPVSHFATVHFLDIHTQTDRWDKQQVCTKSAYALLYWWRATH